MGTTAEKHFIFNENDVCTNANNYDLFRISWIMRASIDTAFTGKGWVYGLSLHGHTWGQSRCCSERSWVTLYSTEKEVFLHALEILKKELIKYPKCKKMLEAVNNQKFFPEFKQLELF